MDMWTMRLNGAGPARGQRECTLSTAQSFAHMTTALDDMKQPNTLAPKYTGRIDFLHAADLRPLRAHTWISND